MSTIRLKLKYSVVSREVFLQPEDTESWYWCRGAKPTLLALCARMNLTYTCVAVDTRNMRDIATNMTGCLRKLYPDELFEVEVDRFQIPGYCQCGA